MTKQPPYARMTLSSYTSHGLISSSHDLTHYSLDIKYPPKVHMVTAWSQSGAIRSRWEFKEGAPRERSLGHWECAPEGDSGTLAPLCPLCPLVPM